MVSKACIVVGVGPGTGAKVAKKFASEGYKVALVARRAEALEPVEQEIKAAGGTAQSFPADTGKPAEVRSAFQGIKDAFGSPEVLVYNAGPSGMTWPPPGILETPIDTFAHSFDSGVTGALAWSQQVLPAQMEAGRGTIIFTGATASLRGGPKFALLACSKFALRALAQCMAREHQAKGIHVSHVIIDGRIDTPRVHGIVGSDFDPKFFLKPEAIADAYWNLHKQHPSAWTHELDLRPYTEKF